MVNQTKTGNCADVLRVSSYGFLRTLIFGYISFSGTFPTYLNLAVSGSISSNSLTGERGTFAENFSIIEMKDFVTKDPISILNNVPIYSKGKEPALYL